MNKLSNTDKIKLPDSIVELLRQWQIPDSYFAPSIPERYVDYLNDTQDFLIRIMLEDSTIIGQISDLLVKLICIKDDIKVFIPRKEND